MGGAGSLCPANGAAGRNHRLGLGVVFLKA